MSEPETTGDEAAAVEDAPPAETPPEAPATPQPTAPLDMEVTRSGVEPAEGLNMYFWGTVVLLGAVLGFYAFQKRIDAEKAALTQKSDAVTTDEGSAAPTKPGSVATSIRTKNDAGFLVRVPNNLKGNWSNAGVNRILRITDPKGKMVIALNSGPVYPWVGLPDLKRLVSGEWRTGAVKSEELGLSFNFAGEAWGLSAATPPQLILVDSGRVIRVLVGDWKDPRVGNILATYRTKKGGDWRSVYKRSFKVDEATATGKPTAKVVKEVEMYLRFLGPKLLKYATPVTVRGVDLYKASKLDHLDTMIVRDLLAPAVKKYQRDKRMANKTVPDRYKRNKKGKKSPH